MHISSGLKQIFSKLSSANPKKLPVNPDCRCLIKTHQKSKNIIAHRALHNLCYFKAKDKYQFLVKFQKFNNRNFDEY
jgi:hypothetical protein